MRVSSNVNTDDIVFTLASAKELSKLGERWRELEERADVWFLNWDWIACWIEEARIAPLVLVGRLGATVVALGCWTGSGNAVIW